MLECLHKASRLIIQTPVSLMPFQVYPLLVKLLGPEHVTPPWQQAPVVSQHTNLGNTSAGEESVGGRRRLSLRDVVSSDNSSRIDLDSQPGSAMVGSVRRLAARMDWKLFGKDQGRGGRFKTRPRKAKAKSTTVHHSSRTQERFGSTGFLAITARRPVYLRYLLQRNFTVLWLDTDAVLTQVSARMVLHCLLRLNIYQPGISGG